MKKIILFISLFILIAPCSFAQTDSNYITRQKNEYYNRMGKNKPGYNQFKRWEWYNSTRLGPGGMIVNNQQLNMEALRSSSINRINSENAIEANTGSWVHIGPASVSSSDKGIGRANRMAFHPSNPDILYLAGASGGLWITQDGGQNWYSYSEGIPNMSLSGVAVDYTNPNIIYILTGDADDNGGIGSSQAVNKPSTGVLKSYDGGFTWHHTGLTWNITADVLAYKIMMHPTNPLILFVATNQGIYRTADGGSTWAVVSFTDIYFDMEFHPTNPSTIYATARISSYIRVYRSTDAGQTFSDMFSLGVELNGTGNSSLNRSALAVSPANPDFVYLLTGPATDEGEFHGFYRSTDQAVTFTLRTNTPNILGRSSTGNDADDQESYDMAVAVSPTNGNTIACGGIRLWTSTNGGSSFTFQDDNESATSYYHADIHDLVYHPLNSGILYMCGDGGVYRSNDNGDNWYSLNNNLQLTQYYRISANPSIIGGAENVVIGGTQDNGTNKRTSSGSSTFSKIMGSDGMDCVIDPDNTSTYVASVQNGKFYYSSNSGSSFELICDTAVLNAALNIQSTPFWVTPVAEIAGNNTQFIMGYNPVIKAIRVSANSYAFVRLGWSGERFVKTARANPNRVFIGGDGKVRTSTNGGNDWTNVFGDVTTNTEVFTDLAFDPGNGSRMWLTFGGYSTTAAKVLHSGNGGDNGGSWTNITGSLPNVPINCIVYDPGGTAIDAIYIGTDIGVFYRDNNLGDWIPFSNGLPVVEVTDLEIHPTTGMLRAGTYGRGMWETDLYSSCPANITLTTANTAIFKPYYFQASQTIGSTAQHYGAGADVFYKAGTEITLTPGFLSGANTFEAAIGPCGGGVPSRVQQKIVKPLKGFLVD
jgi:photosystem II stability/assembly factor-like uncharacterized protein